MGDLKSYAEQVKNFSDHRAVVDLVTSHWLIDETLSDHSVIFEALMAALDANPVSSYSQSVSAVTVSCRCSQVSVDMLPTLLQNTPIAQYVDLVNRILLQHGVPESDQVN